MAVAVRRLTCLSLAGDDEKYYAKKALVGDLVQLNVKGGFNGSLEGRITRIGSSDLTLVAYNGTKSVEVPFAKIVSFSILGRGQKTKDYFVG